MFPNLDYWADTHIHNTLVPEAAYAKQDINQQLQDSPGHNAAEITPGDPNPGELSELKQGNPTGDPAETGNTCLLPALGDTT
jgi:hypothetical protein